jgi:site-specific DNA-cytosine methylase
MTNDIIHLDLFSGIGGFPKVLEQAGFCGNAVTVAVVEMIGQRLIKP